MKDVREPRNAIINAMPIYTMAHTNPALTHAISSLSRREIDVATKLLEGLPNKKLPLNYLLASERLNFTAPIYTKSSTSIAVLRLSQLALKRFINLARPKP